MGVRKDPKLGIGFPKSFTSHTKSPNSEVRQPIKMTKQTLMDDVEAVATSDPPPSTRVHTSAAMHDPAGGNAPTGPVEVVVIRNNAHVPKEEDGPTPDGFGSSFSSAAIRAAFVRKVYAILLSQLAVTTACVAFACFSPTVKNFYCSRTYYDDAGILHCKYVRIDWSFKQLL